MSYFSRIVESLSRLGRSFFFGYIPPGDSGEVKLSLSNAIKDCYNQGKLLVVHLTKNGVGVFPEIVLPEDNFLVLTAPFNSRTMYEIARYFPVNSLPFAGLFYCPSPDHSQIQLLDKIVDMEDLLRCGQHFVNLQGVLLERRSIAIAKSFERRVIVDQDAEFRALEEEALRQQEEKEQIKIKEEEEKKQSEEKQKHVLVRYNSIPVEPPEGAPGVITIRITLPGNEMKIRRFHRDDSVQILFDYVAKDAFPQIPDIKYGFPPQRLVNYSQTFAEAKFARKEAAYVIFRGEGESDEEDDE